MSLVSRTVTTQQIDHGRTGMRMRERRASLQISLRSVARELELSAPYVSDLELGKRNWTVERAREYEAALRKIKGRGF